MTKKNDYLNEISEIRSLMERSSRFLSLSGFSGVVVGLYALIGAFIAQQLVKSGGYNVGALSVVAISVLVASVLTVIWLSYKRCVRNGEPFLNKASKRLAYVMAVPLVTGGVLIVLLILKGIAQLAMPLSLIFYGLAMFSAGRYTYKEVYSMGLVQIITGVLSLVFIDYALLFWAAGFGLLNILYGIYIYFNHEK